MKFSGFFVRSLLVALVSITTTVAFIHPAQAEVTQAKKVKKAPKKPRAVRTTTTRQSAKEAAEEKRPSFASAMGLRGHRDELNLKSSVALVIDRMTHDVLFEKNAHASLPIASITKLMTSLVVMDAHLRSEEHTSELQSH